MYTSSTLGQLLDLSIPLAPKPLVQLVQPSLVLGTGRLRQPGGGDYGRPNGIVDFSNPGKPRQALDKAPADAVWGSRLYGAQGGPRSSRGPICLTIAESPAPLA